MKILRILLVAVLFSFVAVVGAQAEKTTKIGYVDLSRLFDDYHRTKEYDKTLESKTKEFEDQRNTKIEKIREAQGKLGLLTEDKKAELEADIEKMRTELLEYDRQRKTDLTKERNEKIREILLEIEKVVSDFADKENFDIILNDRVLIYGSETNDITDKILTILNSKKK